MTVLARRREAGRRVIRRRRPVVGVAMAPDAVARRPAIDVALVAGGAGLRRVLADQRERGLVVERRLVERRVAGLVARLARRREAARDVVGIARGLVVLLVAREARAVGRAEVAVRVARRAGEGRVRAVERHAREARVIEAHRRPGDGPVALLALVAELKLQAVVLPPYPVAVVALGRRGLVDPVEMTRLAGDVEMPAFEAKRRLVVELAIRRLELSDRGWRKAKCDAREDDQNMK